MTEATKAARKHLEEMADSSGKSAASARTIASAALLIREGLDNLAKAEKRAQKSARIKEALQGE